MSIFGSIAHAVSSGASAIGSAASATGGLVSKIADNPVVKVAGTVAVIAVPGAAQVKAGIDAADKVVKAYNSVNPSERKEAQKVVAATHAVANRHKSHKVRKAAANGLTLMKKRAAALRVVKKYRVNRLGQVYKVK